MGQHAQTIALARGVLAEGRAADVARMLEPLLEPLPQDGDPADGQVALRILLARVRLLREADPPRAFELLAPFAHREARARLAPDVAAEAVLWLGWIYAWPDGRVHDPARALALFAEAERTLAGAPHPDGRWWTLLGRAQAYAALDEAALLDLTLEAAEDCRCRLRDAYAEAWHLDLACRAAFLTGRPHHAERAAGALRRLADDLVDPVLRARACAHRAVLLLAQGQPPDDVVETASEAEHLLARASALPAYPILDARLARLEASLRRDDAEAVDAAAANEDGLAHIPGADAALQLLRVRACLAADRVDAAASLLEEVEARLTPTQRRLAVRCALASARVASRRNDVAGAHRLAGRAHRAAREAGLTADAAEARLLLARTAAEAGDPETALRHLHADDHLDARANGAAPLLPHAAERCEVAGLAALAGGERDEAAASLSLARLAFERIGDVAGAARARNALARLSDGGRERPSPAALLAAAGASPELVAEALLEALDGPETPAWSAVYAADGDDPAEPLAVRGEAPRALPEGDEIRRVRLAMNPEASVYLAAAPGPGAEALFDRLGGLRPLARLALERVLPARARLHPDGAPPPGDAGSGILPFPDDVVRRIRALRASYGPVLVSGERGAGHETAARMLHAASERRDGPFVAFDCSSLPPELLESQLFGPETENADVSGDGAPATRDGVLRAADTGTLFLEAVEALPLDVQGRLLRFLRVPQLLPAGRRRPLTLSVRIVAATTTDLAARVRDGRFREELRHQLATASLPLPPLRERPEEIPLVVHHCIRHLRPTGSPLASMTSRAMEALMRYEWPGNLRQLRNEIERALALAASDPVPVIDLKELSAVILDGAGPHASAPDSTPGAEGILPDGHDLDDLLAITEKSIIERVLAANDGQVSTSADVLGLTRQGLYKKMKRLGIDASRFHAGKTAVLS